jgi:hypothetical protein
MIDLSVSLHRPLLIIYVTLPPCSYESTLPDHHPSIPEAPTFVDQPKVTETHGRRAMAPRRDDVLPTQRGCNIQAGQ